MPSAPGDEVEVETRVIDLGARLPAPPRRPARLRRPAASRVPRPAAALDHLDRCRPLRGRAGRGRPGDHRPAPPGPTSVETLEPPADAWPRSPAADPPAGGGRGAGGPRSAGSWSARCSSRSSSLPIGLGAPAAPLDVRRPPSIPRRNRSATAGSRRAYLASTPATCRQRWVPGRPGGHPATTPNGDPVAVRKEVSAASRPMAAGVDLTRSGRVAIVPAAQEPLLTVRSIASPADLFRARMCAANGIGGWDGIGADRGTVCDQQCGETHSVGGALMRKRLVGLFAGRDDRVRGVPGRGQSVALGARRHRRRRHRHRPRPAKHRRHRRRRGRPVRTRSLRAGGRHRRRPDHHRRLAGSHPVQPVLPRPGHRGQRRVGRLGDARRRSPTTTSTRRTSRPRSRRSRTAASRSRATTATR